MMAIVGFLPPPPLPENPENWWRDPILVAAIVAVILGLVVLIAWLLKPMVIQRMRRDEEGDEAERLSPERMKQWNEAWAPHDETEQPRQNRIAAPVDSVRAPRQESEDVPAGEAAPVESPASRVQAPAAVMEPAVPSTPTAVGLEEIIAITATVRALLERANSGRVRDGFSLYTDAAVDRFRIEMGLTEEEFKTAFDDVQPPPQDRKAELSAVSKIERLSDGRIRAAVSYGDGGSNPPPEVFTFVRSDDGQWLIDEIATAT